MSDSNPHYLPLGITVQKKQDNLRACEEWQLRITKEAMYSEHPTIVRVRKILLEAWHKAFFAAMEHGHGDEKMNIEQIAHLDGELVSLHIWLGDENG